MSDHGEETQTPAEEQLVIVGERRRPLRDLYHAFLRWPWPLSLLSIVAFYLSANVLFAFVFLYTGGIHGAEDGSFLDALFFSVQTMGTIGYGALYPETRLANAVVVVESVVGMLVTAVSAGLVFAKFARTTSRIRFGRKAGIAPLDGVPTLMLRVGNERGNAVLDAVIRVTLTRTEKTREGELYYRFYDLELTRDRAPALSRMWLVLHPIGPSSPLSPPSPELLHEHEIELVVSVSGLDDTTSQPVVARHRYLEDDIVFGARPADVLRDEGGGRFVVDLQRFHTMTPTRATAAFPFSDGKRVEPEAPQAEGDREAR